MNYECQLENGQHLEMENEGDQTFLSLGNHGEGQSQSQGHGFTTGAWSRKPEVYRLEGDDYIIRVATEGTRFLRVSGNQMTLLDREPDLAQANQKGLKEFSQSRRMAPMKPLEPMRAMEPMKPMRPMN
jgi:hypothetical protein